MHLLNVKTRKLETFLNRAVPPYAILSHTWGEDEATFADFQSTRRRWRLRVGSVKINGCCAQAASDGLDYVWIDSCCIDKRSSAELSEAINSMFRWYSEATVCYVYLADVRPLPRLAKRDHARDPPKTQSWPPLVDSAQLDDVRKSRWFTRGWTLQELLAPSLLKIYDSAWNLIGYSMQLASIHASGSSGHHQLWDTPRITTLLADVARIPIKYLQRGDLHEATVAERMSWAAHRQTTRAEDRAYCLLGLFGVNMPMLYGEGEGAFLRLLDEIVKKYDDQSIFAWGLDGLPPGPRIEGSTVMAISPADFQGCGHVTLQRPANDPSSHYVTTNAGIHIDLPLIQLRSGEYLARMNCTVDSGEPDVLLEDKYLALILIQSRNQKKVFYRRTSASPTLVPVRYFEHARRQSIYLAPAPTVTYHLTRSGPLFVAAACAQAFAVVTTYPAVLDVEEGVYFLVSDLRHHIENGSGIFLDCVSVTGERFAIRVQFVVERDQQRDSGSRFVAATMCISRQRHIRSMVELMVPEEMDGGVNMEWETDAAIGNWRVVIGPAETDQWKIDVAMAMIDASET